MLLIPTKGEGRKVVQGLCLVEGKQNQNEDGGIENAEDDPNVRTGQESHTISPPSSSSENLFMTATEIKMRIIMIREMAAPIL